MTKRRKTGTVYLVGAGPGDVGLLTLRGMALLGQADVVVYDWLVNSEMLAFCATAEKHYVGKNVSRKRKTNWAGHQKEINQLLVKCAKQGKAVVRLKGGDPFVFGRGTEEVAFLKEKKIPFEIIPGITSGIAGPAYAGIPVTDRKRASSVTFVTAVEEPGKVKTSVQWKHLAESEGTLVVFMGVKKLPEICEALMSFGKPAQTKVAVVENATRPQQRVVEGTLRTIAKKIASQKIKSPALTVIGQVTELRSKLQWFERTLPQARQRKSLVGKNVLVTRASSQASSLRKLLEQKGANVLEFPAIKIIPPKSFKKLDEALNSIERFDWIIFTSVNAVESVLGRVQAIKKDIRLFANVKVAAVGNATAEYLCMRGLRPDLMPKKFTSKALIQSLRVNQVKGKHFLLPRTNIAPESLKDELEKKGAKATEVIAYRTLTGYGVPERKQLEKWLEADALDYITFTSSSAVRNFMEALAVSQRKQIAKQSRFVSIGPVTTQTIKDYGFKPYREAAEHTIPGLVKTLL